MASYSVFTKPWRTAPVGELIEIVRGMGFTEIEFPLRDGSQVCPEQAEKMLPGFAKRLADAGIRIGNVASSPEERVFAACADCGIPMIRVMFTPPMADNYLEQEAEYLREIDSWIPLCEKYGVQIGLQMHHGRGAMTSADMARILARFEPEHIGAIWDAAHSGLAGENTEQSLDVCWSRLCQVNFKNARYEMKGRGADGAALFATYFCPGADGLTSWPRAVEHLKKKGYAGTYCMPAEYTNLTSEEEQAYAKRDRIWLKSLVEG